MTATVARDSTDSTQGEARTFRSFDGARLVHYVRGSADSRSTAVILLDGVQSIDLTRPSRDGGRDAVGSPRISSGRGFEVRCEAPARLWGALKAPA